ncbi:hypothetical protein QJS66_17685 [Kocuria rhizophila]|nr:hypothetical protein QJS66_17685 [Kocuria rhizophila]
MSTVQRLAADNGVATEYRGFKGHRHRSGADAAQRADRAGRTSRTTTPPRAPCASASWHRGADRRPRGNRGG